MDCSHLLYLQEKYQPQYTDYFFDCLPRILSKGYLPSDEDIIRCYIRTTGIHSDTINVRGSSVTLLDSGGQKSERKKWKYAIPKTEVVIFVASLSDYNEVLVEDETINRMQDSLKLFNAIINSRSLDDVPVILFLNKTDLFAQKLRNVPLKDYFPDYTGGDDYNAGCGFIIDKFLALNKRPTEVGILEST
ncbi:G-alpha-domain-containing protein [Gymnopus androsaceus JB14]|uniref:G-alpha-domain-containing protein n=1 Tax=Gymnopus androsaceus JB14 TaxID=1447944 RepID=A0A6A4HZA5_9AGAR|nr:G-alpha-domain-containing protein [Gymnopus androsaceus JB14]